MLMRLLPNTLVLDFEYGIDDCNELLLQNVMVDDDGNVLGRESG
jgi:hypothetical protein